MKWIKAIERLPDHMVPRALRVNELHYTGGYYDYSRKVFMVQNMGPNGLSPKDIEWLDESAQVEPDAVAFAAKNLIRIYEGGGNTVETVEAWDNLKSALKNK